jgi:hypothetical protein
MHNCNWRKVNSRRQLPWCNCTLRWVEAGSKWSLGIQHSQGAIDYTDGGPEGVR